MLMKHWSIDDATVATHPNPARRVIDSLATPLHSHSSVEVGGPIETKPTPGSSRRRGVSLEYPLCPFQPGRLCRCGARLAARDWNAPPDNDESNWWSPTEVVLLERVPQQVFRPSRFSPDHRTKTARWHQRCTTTGHSFVRACTVIDVEANGAVQLDEPTHSTPVCSPLPDNEPGGLVE